MQGAKYLQAARLGSVGSLFQCSRARLSSLWIGLRKQGVLLPLSIAAGLLIGLHGTSVIAINRMERSEIQEGLRRVESHAIGLEGWLRRTFDGLSGVLDLVEERQRSVDSRSGPGHGVSSVLHQFADARRLDIVGAGTIDPDGFSRWTTLPANIATYMADRIDFEALRQGSRQIQVNGPIISRLTGRRVIFVSRRMDREDGSFAGVAVVWIDPILVSRHLAEMIPPEALRISVWRDGGEVILRNVWAMDPPIGPEWATPSLVEVMRDRDQASERIASVRDNRDLLASTRRIVELGLVLAVGMATSEATSTSHDLRSFLGLGDVLGALFLLIGVVLLQQIRSRQSSQATIAAGVAREAIAASTQAEIRRTLDTVPGVVYRGLYRDDGSCEIHYLSPSFSTITGMRGDEILVQQTGLLHLCDPPVTAAELMAIRLGLVGGRRVARDCRIRLADGGVRWMRFTEQAVAQDERGIEIAGLVIDIEAERMASASAMAASRLATLGEMATGIAHELSQPLAAISMIAENAAAALRKGRVEDAVARLDRVPPLARRARDIIDHLRQFGGSDHADLEAVKLSEVVEGTLLLMQGSLKEAFIALSVDVPEDLRRVRAGRALLERVLMNLLLNARDAVASNPVHDRQVTLTAREIESHLAIAVEDNGRGISADALSRIFEPFFTTKPTGQGAGLGLAICHGIIRSFAGTITATSEGVGARFVITLPIMQDTSHPG